MHGKADGSSFWDTISHHDWLNIALVLIGVLAPFVLLLMGGGLVTSAAVIACVLVVLVVLNDGDFKVGIISAILSLFSLIGVPYFFSDIGLVNERTRIALAALDHVNTRKTYWSAFPRSPEVQRLEDDLLQICGMTTPSAGLAGVDAAISAKADPATSLVISASEKREPFQDCLEMIDAINDVSPNYFDDVGEVQMYFSQLQKRKPTP